MRLRACLGLALLGASACTTLPGLPGHILLDVDGNIVELRKKPAPEAPPAPEPAPATPAPATPAPPPADEPAR